MMALLVLLVVTGVMFRRELASATRQAREYEPARGKILRAISGLRAEVIALGFSARKVVTFSLENDSPHIGLSIAPGGGKSTIAKLIAAQILHRGGVVVILDIKRHSHPWAKTLPNVIYCNTAASIHEALVWLASEMERRNDVVDGTMDVEGDTHAEVGVRVMIVFEEMNATIGKLRKYWKSVKEKDDPAESPALEAWADLGLMGRAVCMTILAVAQMLTAKATGGNDLREAIGTRILGRYTKQNWEMLASKFRMPPCRNEPGWVQLVTDRVQEVRVTRLSGRAARRMALSGEVAALPWNVPEALLKAHHRPTGPMPSTLSGLGKPSEPIGQWAEPLAIGPSLVGLREAVSSGVFDGKSLETVRHLRKLDGFPAPSGQRGREHLYDTSELRDWMAAHTGDKVKEDDRDGAYGE